MQVSLIAGEYINNGKLRRYHQVGKVSKISDLRIFPAAPCNAAEEPGACFGYVEGYAVVGVAPELEKLKRRFHLFHSDMKWETQIRSDLMWRVCLT